MILNRTSLLIKLLVICLTYSHCNSTYIEGDIDLEEDFFFKFLLKFGFSKTEKSIELNYGYIFGNITSNVNYKYPITLAVLDRHHFLEFYSNRTITNRHLACQRMFARLNYTAFDKQCNTEGKGDYLRRIPCKQGQLCEDEDSPKNVIRGSQFTYIISNVNQPRFWYISIVSCYRNQTTCEWEYVDHKQNIQRNLSREVPNLSSLHYSMNLVNGHPNKEQSFYSPFIYQFSFDQQHILEQFIIFFVVYLVLVPIQVHGARKQSHPLTKLFTFSLILEFTSTVFILIHLTKFSMNGIGNESLEVAGDIFDILSRTSFMLVLLLLAKGWAVTRLEISTASWVVLITIWLSYCTINVFLYIWNQTEVDVVSDIDEYQTWPGWLVIISRSMIMLWFLYELRNTMKYEHSSKKLDFLLHFGASSLVWFIYLPIIALIALQVSPLWRNKLLLAVTNSVDCLAYCVLMSLLWPDRSGQYILLANRNSSRMDELDEFNEAPHILHRDVYSSSLEQNNENDQIDDGDAEIDTLVLSTDDLLVNNIVTTTSGDNLLIINGDASQLITNNSSKSRSKDVFS